MRRNASWTTGTISSSAGRARGRVCPGVVKAVLVSVVRSSVGAMSCLPGVSRDVSNRGSYRPCNCINLGLRGRERKRPQSWCVSWLLLADSVSDFAFRGKGRPLIDTRGTVPLRVLLLELVMSTGAVTAIADIITLDQLCAAGWDALVATPMVGTGPQRRRGAMAVVVFPETVESDEEERAPSHTCRICHRRSRHHRRHHARSCGARPRGTPRRH